MATINLKGNPIETAGDLPLVGTQAPSFNLRKTDLSFSILEDYKGSRVILNIFPSLDTGTCAAAVRQFNQMAANLPNTKVLCISRDLPFAHKRFCTAEGIENVTMLSDFTTGDFGKDYGLRVVNGPMEGLNSRVVMILNADGQVEYTQQVMEISSEPNYDEVLNALK